MDGWVGRWMKEWKDGSMGIEMSDQRICRVRKVMNECRKCIILHQRATSIGL